MKIEIGNVIELRNGDKFIYHHSGNGFSLDGKFMCDDVLNAFDENYEMFNATRDYGIMRIYSDYTLTSLLWERQEDVQGEISETERTILSAVYPTYKYIARDKDGELFVYKVKPVKIDNKYCCDMYTDYSDFKAFNHLFKFVSWDDENPRQIVSLLH